MSPNRLAHEASPYLLQHADNPVDWYPWGEEALARAREEDRPILLSIGYAACHWCHVMAHESFEDPEVAARMNRDFVCVKVDREERPDVDAIYMDAVQAMTGHGGWPLTAFLTPDGRPFFAGTYFPDAPRHGMPSFTQVLEAIAEVWRERRADAEEQATRVIGAIGREARIPGGGPVAGPEVLEAALRALEGSFDREHGGFGGAPKFPQPTTLAFLLRMHARGADGALDLLVPTLRAMARGGIRDQLGGGFHRYATDARWLVPHFERMLPDNAQLARVYAAAWQVTRDPEFRRVAQDVCGYLLDDLRHPEGGFLASQDADSDGEEGRFFAWTWDEIVGAVGAEAARAFGASPAGNWEGRNVLTLADPDADLDDARAVLRELREGRPHPATDDKVLAGWNGLAIAALAEAGWALGDPSLVAASARAADFVLAHLVDDRGRLHRSWRGGRLGPAAVAEDHALLADGLLSLFAATGEPRYVRAARGLAEDLLARFEDPEHGGFFATAADAEPLVVRPKDLQDNALPSGNSAAAEALLRLAALTGDVRLARAATGALALLRDVAAAAPTGFGAALGALARLHAAPREVAIVGDPDDPRTRALVDEVLGRRFLPFAVTALAAPTDADALAGELALLADRSGVTEPTAFVCERFACRLPVTTPEDLAAQLDATAG
ncbi:MAG: thioredoxin domain-containing protein [Actinomycetota bacterium]